MNGNCPSKMKVCQDIENHVSVEFTKTHVGHGTDFGRMPIKRKRIARKLESKISSVNSPITDEEEIVTCEDRNFLKKNSTWG
ncbi:hypothetical protein NPIL_70031 [Nephila pilipes]|uniref:Uncharacterized protein n=1 Tax=Nephila pilipes TaxID=299642 RepID=A0A8X6T8V7_NEPPI|nr:hypothetical protein NPIL_70031 [Nephila pilipes]